MDLDTHPALNTQSDVLSVKQAPTPLLVDAVQIALLSDGAISSGTLTLPFDPKHAQFVFLQEETLIIITNSGSAFILEDFLIAVEIDLLHKIMLPSGETFNPLDFLENFATDPTLIDDMNSIDAANAAGTMPLTINDMVDMTGSIDVHTGEHNTTVQALTAEFMESGIAATTLAPYLISDIPTTLFPSATNEEPVF